MVQTTTKKANSESNNKPIVGGAVIPNNNNNNPSPKPPPVPSSNRGSNSGGGSGNLGGGSSININPNGPGGVNIKGNEINIGGGGSGSGSGSIFGRNDPTGCMNGGYRPSAGLPCRCPNGYSGPRCEFGSNNWSFNSFGRDLCASYPCLNNAVLTNK